MLPTDESESHLPNESELILLAKAGNNAAFNQLFAKYKETVYQYAMRALGDHDKADEATQQTLIWAWENIAKSPTDASKFKFWMLAACKFKNKNVRRALMSTDNAWNLRLDNERGFSAVWTSMGTLYPDERPLAFDPHQHLHLLPYKQRRCLELQLKGRSISQIARVMHLKKNAVYFNLKEARRKMRKIRKDTELSTKNLLKQPPEPHIM